MSERCDAPIGGRPGAYVKCDREAWSYHGCPWCTKGVLFCRKAGHEKGALQLLDGHKLRCHPDKMHDALRLISRDPERMAVLRDAAQRMPAHYAQLVEELSKLGITL